MIQNGGTPVIGTTLANVTASNIIANTLQWTGMATIPLKQLHDFFDKLPTVGSSQGFEIRIQTNIGTNTYSITKCNNRCK